MILTGMQKRCIVLLLWPRVADLILDYEGLQLQKECVIESVAREVLNQEHTEAHCEPGNSLTDGCVCRARKATAECAACAGRELL